MIFPTRTIAAEQLNPTFILILMTVWVLFCSEFDGKIKKYIIDVEQTGMRIPN
jgi:hypothetical protein